MGAGIAQIFASHGHETIIFDRGRDEVEAGWAMIGKQLARQRDKGRLSPEEMEATLARLSRSVDPADARESDLVVEAIFEELSVKRELFAALEAICPPSCLFATNTSSLSVTEIAAGLKHEDRVIGLHFFNPAPVMKLVEVVLGEKTSAETVSRASELVQSIGKEAVFCRDSPGFIVNRLLIPMINEAVDLLFGGTASRDDIDQAMKLGANHPMGPLQLADFIGIDIVKNIMEIIRERTGDAKYEPSPLLERMATEGKLGRKTGEGFYLYE